VHLCATAIILPATPELTAQNADQDIMPADSATKMNVLKITVKKQPIISTDGLTVGALKNAVTLSDMQNAGDYSLNMPQLSACGKLVASTGFSQ
jgi:hypothetical protein